jgi:hypothetical protein
VFGQGATGGRVVSLHHDVSTGTGEEVVLFAPAEALGARDLERPLLSAAGAV